MSLRVHHIAIICSDYQRSLHFYNVVLGFEVIREVCRKDRESYKTDLQLPGGMQIELFSFPNPPQRHTYPEAVGLRHLAFCVSDLDAAVNHLSRFGIKSEAIRTDENTGKRFVFFSDPDGLPLELYEDE